MNKIIALLIMMIIIIGCKKSDFLGVKPKSTLLVPTKLDDFQKLLDHIDMNVTGSLGEVSSDNYYYLSKKNWQNNTLPQERLGYIWAKDIYQGRENIEDWNLPYRQILYANVVLEGLESNQFSTVDSYRVQWIKGWAHFIRAHAYFNLAQHFTLPYNEKTAVNTIGLPLRLSSNVNLRVPRSTLQETYQLILSDLQIAVDNLPDKLPGSDRNRPYKLAAFSLHARVSLCMNNFAMALEYANKAIEIYSTLIDFNTLSTTAPIPIDRLNAEAIFNAQLLGVVSSLTIGSYRTMPNVAIDSNLYASYSNNDLRKSILYATISVSGKPGIKASYVGTINPFGGIATNELYLIKAECLIRIGDFKQGLNVLNQLLIKRWRAGTYNNYDAPNQDAALSIVLSERRKEIPFRGLRWLDIRRLNVLGHNIILQRNLDGEKYALPANSLNYALPIPDSEINLQGIEQNIRN